MTDYETCQCSSCVARRERDYRSEQKKQRANYLREILGREPNLCDCGPCTKSRNENIAKALKKTGVSNTTATPKVPIISDACDDIY